IAELAKQLEQLVEQDRAESIILDVDVHKDKRGPSDITVRINKFYGNWAMDSNTISLDALDREEIVDGVTFQYRYFQRLNDSFYFTAKLDPNTLYRAIKEHDLYIVSWDDKENPNPENWVDYQVDFVEKAIRNG